MRAFRAFAVGVLAFSGLGVKVVRGLGFLGPLGAIRV